MARRTARRRRARRLTPRRWLPFVALVALVAIVVVAVIVSTEEPATPPTPNPSVFDTSRMPSVSSVDAIASNWYCGGGTATGEDGTAELTLILANDDRRGAVAEITFMGAAGKEARTEVDVPAHGRARVRASEFLEAEWVGALVDVRGGRVGVDREVTGPLGFSAAPCASTVGDHWFVASGSTVRGAKEYLSLFNPLPDAASVTITFATDSGRRAPRPLRALSIPGRSVRTIDVGAIITNRSAVAATIITRSGRIVVDRVQTYDGKGEDVGSGDAANPPEGLVSTPAIPVRAPRWIIPGARVTDGVETQIAVYNPGSQTAEVDIAVSYEEPKLRPEVEPVGLTIRPREQAVVSVNEIPGVVSDLDAWVDVRSLDGVPVVAERLSFFGEPSPRSGATITAGSPIAANDWMVTQAGATKARATSVQVVNPGDTSARITVITLSGGDRDVLESASVVIPGRDRRTLDLEGAASAATVIVHGSRPVVVASSLSMKEGPGISVQPALPFPETVVALPPVS